MSYTVDRGPGTPGASAMNKPPLSARIYVVMMIAAAAMTLLLPPTRNRATISASFVADFATLLRFAAHQGMWIATASAISQPTTRVTPKTPPHRTLFNVASLIVTVQVTGLLYRLLGG